MAFFTTLLQQRRRRGSPRHSPAIPFVVASSLICTLTIGIAATHQPYAVAQETPPTQPPEIEAPAPDEPAPEAQKYTLEELEQRPLLLADVPPELLSATSIQVSDLTNAGLLSPKLVALFPPELTKAVYTTWRAIAVVINTAAAIFVVVTTPVGDYTQGPVIQAEPPPVVEVPKPPSKPPEKEQPQQPADGANADPPTSSTTTTTTTPPDDGAPVTVPNPNPAPAPAPAPPPAPEATDVLSVTPTESSHPELRVTWRPVAAETWNIYRSTGGPAVFLATIPGSQTQYIDAAVEPGKGYAYNVAAVIQGREAPWAPNINNAATTPAFTPYQPLWSLAPAQLAGYLRSLQAKAAWDNGEPGQFLDLNALHNVRVALGSVLTRVEDDPESPTSPCTMIPAVVGSQTGKGLVFSSPQRCSPDVIARDNDAIANAQRWVKAIRDLGMRQYAQGLLDLRGGELQDQVHRQATVVTTYAQLAEVPVGYGTPESVVEAKVIHDYQITHAPPPSGGFNFFFFLIPLAIVFAPFALAELFGVGATAAAGGAALSIAGCVAGVAVVGVPTCPI